jgi:inhibitor of KinA sporulation pathway (predicted exonuclease)
MEIYYCVLDFEATCWDNMKGKFHEIIEFPSILWSYDGTKLTNINNFQEFVKPVYNPILSKFCTDLTGITQDKIDTAKSLENILKLHKKWLYDNVNAPDSKIFIITCGDWDFNVCLANEAKLHDIELASIYKKWINIKSEFKQFYGRKTGLGMVGMLKVLDLKLEGRHHSGFDDCHNISRVFQKMVDSGYDPKSAIIKEIYK